MTQRSEDTTPANQNGVERTLTRHGGLSYLVISAEDFAQSATFYEHVLNWTVEWRGDDDARFRDVTGHLIGRWVKGQATSREPGLLPYFYVGGLDRAIQQVLEQRGEVVRTPYREGSLSVATVRDPAGNLIGLWQDGPR